MNKSLNSIQMRKQLPLIALLILIILLAVIFYFRKEGFADLSGATDPNIIHSRFVNTQQLNFNPLGISLIAANNEGALGTTADPLMQTVGSTATYPLSPVKTGLFAKIAKCEALTTSDCSAFDDPSFAADCGVCIDIGKNSKGASATGGLVLLENDRVYPRTNVKKGGIPNYTATVGSCPANRLVSSKAECIKMKRKIECQKKGNYDLKDCSQCYSDQSYDIIDSDPAAGVISSAGTIYVIGNGTLTYTETGYSTVSGVSLSSTPYVINLQGLEGTRLSITVTAPSKGIISLAGYLGGTTGTGEFTMDLYRLVLTDTTTGRKPRTTKTVTVNGNTATTMGPGFGQKQMTLVLPMPFSFVDPATDEASLCKDSPFITKQASSEFLNSDPCYKKGSGPGTFSLECLQSLYLSNGCIQDGNAYPGDSAAATKLMTNADGTYRSLNDIADIVYANAVASSTGVSVNGQKLEIPEWSKTSVFCTGKTITSPCDIGGKSTGPLSIDCLTYLWNNGGGKKNAAGVVNPSEATYSLTSMASSLFTTNNEIPRFCQAKGTLSPIDVNGNPNQSAIDYWNGIGGVDAVKAEMNKIHTMANTPNMSDAERFPYLMKCYGVTKLAAPVEGQSMPGVPGESSPANAPLSVFQTLFKKAGCTRTLVEGDIGWWRKQAWDGIKSDMAEYARLTANCSGNKNQTEFCIPGKCFNQTYNCTKAGVDHGGDDIECNWSGMTEDIMRSKCDNNPNCRGYNLFVNNGAYGGCIKTKTPINNGNNPAVLKMCSKTQPIGGNNGTVSCETYCRGPGGGRPWNGELPQSWNGASCVKSLLSNDIGCNSGFLASLPCLCQATGTGWN